MPRFEIKYLDEITGYKDPQSLNDDEWDWSDPAFLVDNKTNTVVFVDPGFEPEDATLDRAFTPLVDLINELTED